MHAGKFSTTSFVVSTTNFVVSTTNLVVCTTNFVVENCCRNVAEFMLFVPYNWREKEDFFEDSEKKSTFLLTRTLGHVLSLHSIYQNIVRS